MHDKAVKRNKGHGRKDKSDTVVDNPTSIEAVPLENSHMKLAESPVLEPVLSSEEGDAAPKVSTYKLKKKLYSKLERKKYNMEKRLAAKALSAVAAISPEVAIVASSSTSIPPPLPPAVDTIGERDVVNNKSIDTGKKHKFPRKEGKKEGISVGKTEEKDGTVPEGRIEKGRGEKKYHVEREVRIKYDSKDKAHGDISVVKEVNLVASADAGAGGMFVPDSVDGEKEEAVNTKSFRGGRGRGGFSGGWGRGTGRGGGRGGAVNQQPSVMT